MEQRATVFGADAARYDRSRPGYPAELIDLIVPKPPARVVDVGCGTGIVSRLFAQRGCTVLGVEPDVRMASVARASGVEVEIARFEDWIAGGRVFDVVVSAQAWHWIDPVAGPTIAHRALAPGGTLAILWNVPHHDPALLAAFEDLYDRFRLPDGSRCSPPGAVAEDSTQFIAGIRAADGFSTAVETSRSWSQWYTAAEWSDLLPTHSNHRLLAADDLNRLLAATRATIDEFGGRIEVTYTTSLITANVG